MNTIKQTQASQKASQALSSGLTLLETLVAVAIFMIIMTAIMNMFPTVFKVNGQTRADQSTTIAAKAYMEDMRVYLSSTLNFDGTAVLAAPNSNALNGYACTPTMTNEDTGTTTAGTSVALIKRVTLTCTKTGQSTLVFTQDFGRPDFPILAPSTALGGS